MAVTRLVAYLVGVASMGMIAQGVVGNALHDVVWTTRERTVPGEARIVTETTTVRDVTVTRRGAPGETVHAPATTKFVTVPGPTATTTVPGPAVTTTVSGKQETVLAPPASTVTTTVPGPTTTTTVPGPVTTTTVQAAAVTTTVSSPAGTVTVPVTEACDPPPKKPSNPPCPPHK